MTLRGLISLGGLARGAAMMAAALAITACGAIQNMMPDPADFHFPNRNTVLPNNVAAYARPVSIGPAGPGELVDSEGRCAGPVGAAPDASTARGVGIDMTECEVVRALGPPQSAAIDPRPAEQRTAVLTYAAGDRPGIYRFNGGRLVSIERGAELPPPVERKPPARKPRPSTAQSVQ